MSDPGHHEGEGERARAAAVSTGRVTAAPASDDSPASDENAHAPDRDVHAPVAGAFPPIDQLVRHSGPMSLLDRVVSHDEDTTVCEVRVDASTLFRDAEGRVPVWVGIEYMAQCVAVHGGLVWHTREDRPKPGLFLGARRLKIKGTRFEPGTVLTVRARHLKGESGMVQFACAIDDPAGGEPLAEGILNVYVVDDFEALAKLTTHAK
jgi:predicted hotdog family 3-hydroxylacyl-ACP dehydratase